MDKKLKLIPIIRDNKNILIAKGLQRRKKFHVPVKRKQRNDIASLNNPPQSSRFREVPIF